MSQREAWIDAAKGISILLVVIYHVLVSSADAGLIAQGDPLSFILVSGGMMAVFMFFAGRGVRNKLDPLTALRSIFRGNVFPYLVWGAIFLLAQSAGSGLRNDAGTVEVDLSLIWTPIAWLWFLFAVAIYHAVASALRRHVTTLLVVGVAALPLSSLAPTLFSQQLAFFLAFYVAGIIWGTQTIPKKWWHGLAGIILALLAWQLGIEPFTALVAPAAGLLMLGIFTAARQLAGSSALVWLGQRTLPIYVSHFFFITATRIILDKGLGITNFAIHLPLGFAAGLAGSLALLAISQRLGFAGLLGFGLQPATWQRRDRT